MADYGHVLLAVDFAQATESLVLKAVGLAQRYDARLSLAHVVEPVIIDPSYDVFPAVPLGMEQELVDKSLSELRKLGLRHGIAVDDCHVVIGSTKTEILRLAEAQQVDLIVVGSHGRHGVALLLGSTANAVLHGAPCDVLAVRIR